MSVDCLEARVGKSARTSQRAGPTAFMFRKSSEMRPRKASKGGSTSDRTKTDTGRRDEKSKALGRTLVKELCNMTP